MLKLKYLFNNPDLALMLLKNWDYDETSLELFQYFRISANAIYPFRQKGELCFLRFYPTSEKLKENMLAELGFIGYLRGKDYNALEPILSKTGDVFLQKSTPWGEYFASVFRSVKGKQISESNLDDEIMFTYGAALGQLHELSSGYTPSNSKRWTHVDVFNWIEEILIDLAPNPLPLNELRLLKATFSSLPINLRNYGLVHYDFEPDNVFYDGSTKSCSVIDFDDAMYHWYIMDIEQALDSIKEEITEIEFPHKKAIFLEGYRSHFDLDNDLLAAMPIFRRFANLYSYTRNIRSIQESWENEPEWLVTLRKKLTGSLAKQAQLFGKPIALH